MLVGLIHCTAFKNAWSNLQPVWQDCMLWTSVPIVLMSLRGKFSNKCLSTCICMSISGVCLLRCYEEVATSRNFYLFSISNKLLWTCFLLSTVCNASCGLFKCSLKYRMWGGSNSRPLGHQQNGLDHLRYLDGQIRTNIDKYLCCLIRVSSRHAYVHEKCLWLQII